MKTWMNLNIHNFGTLIGDSFGDLNKRKPFRLNHYLNKDKTGPFVNPTTEFRHF